MMEGLRKNNPSRGTDTAKHRGEGHSSLMALGFYGVSWRQKESIPVISLSATPSPTCTPMIYLPSEDVFLVLLLVVGTSVGVPILVLLYTRISVSGLPHCPEFTQS